MWNWLERRELQRLSRHMGDQDPGRLPRPDLPAGSDLLPQIKHIVVLMMENHSYDNYLGMLAGRGEGFPLGPDGEPDVSNPGADGESVRAHHLASTVQQPEVPSQSWHASHLQCEGKCDGFVSSTQAPLPGKDATVGMGYWSDRDLPFYYGLARAFRSRTTGSARAWGPRSPTAGS